MKIIVKDLIDLNTKNNPKLSFRTIKRRFRSTIYKSELCTEKVNYTLYISDNPFLANCVHDNLFLKINEKTPSKEPEVIIDIEEIEKSIIENKKIKGKEASTFNNPKLMKLLKSYIASDINAKGLNE